MISGLDGGWLISHLHMQWYNDMGFVKSDFNVEFEVRDGAVCLCREMAC